MFMDIDQAGCDDPSMSIEDFCRVGCRNIRLQECNFSLTYRNIHRAIDFLTRIQNTAALDDKIVFECYWKWQRYRGEDNRRGQKLTTIHGGNYTLSPTIAYQATRVV